MDITASRQEKFAVETQAVERIESELGPKILEIILETEISNNMPLSSDQVRGIMNRVIHRLNKTR